MNRNFPSNPTPKYQAYGQRAPGSGRTNPYRPQRIRTSVKSQMSLSSHRKLNSSQRIGLRKIRTGCTIHQLTPTIVASAYPATHGPGHTPCRYRNTHDGDYGTEATANWIAAGKEARCLHEGCTHYHDR